MKENRETHRAKAVRWLPWISAWLIISVIFGSIYTLVQQDVRQNANDPQIQLAQDAAAELSSGTPLADVAKGHVDLDKSLAPAVIIYNRTGSPLVGNGYIGGALPTFPRGALRNADAYHAVTWQPTKTLRLAAVIVKASDDRYVLSARSLKEVEARENMLENLTGFDWLLAMVILLASCWLYNRLKREKRASPSRAGAQH